MKFLIIKQYIHHKNKIGIIFMLNKLKISYKIGTPKDIPDYDVIYFPSSEFNTSNYKNKKFIFGPHFSVFPIANQLKQIKNINNNSFYITPSIWVKHIWINPYIPIKVLPFAIDCDKFKPDEIKKRDKVFIYFKNRHREDLNFIKSYLNEKKIDYFIFVYSKYNEKDYLQYLKESKYGIVIAGHESQGFAIEEALSCNVPLLVWRVNSMKQENGKNKYNDIYATTIPYWDKRCGEFFTKKSDFEKTYNTFMSNLDIYKPREYVLENLNDEACSKLLYNLITE